MTTRSRPTAPPRANPHPRPMAPSGAPAGMERNLLWRSRVLLGFWILCGGGLLARAAELQLVEGAEWRAEAEQQHRMQGEVAAARGTILDRYGTPLAVSEETFRIGVAPHELSDRGGVAEVLARALELSNDEALAITQSSRRWVSVPGRFPPAVREALSGVRGVYVERELRRFYPRDGLAGGLLGVVIDGQGVGGVEQAFEQVLEGTPGTAILARDASGRAIPGESWLVDAPVAGGRVVLTLDAGLQEIALEALRDAVESTGARGGDLLVTDPRTGDVLAMVSLRDGASTHLGSINTPYEPGSTLKPFTVATLLREGRAALQDSVDTEGGRWVTQGRTITDVSRVGVVTLAHALQVSSNVGIAKLAIALAPDEQYEGLRDFGFGIPTGIDLPGEAPGTLRRPAQWSRQSSASLAIGYEIAVTPLQMAMAYGALANGGVLMEPRIVRELWDGNGVLLLETEPRAVRRVISEEVAAELTEVLVGAVETGTGTQARLASFAVAGKSGTSRATGDSGAYEQGAYFASFVGFFPAEDPQLVVFVKLERPQGAYYGGVTAAPVTRATLEAILAARNPPLDRGALAMIARSQGGEGGPVQVVGPTPARTVIFASASSPLSGAPSSEAMLLPLPDGSVLVPDLRGVAPRTAAARLHAMGLTVLWEGGGPIGGSSPGPGVAIYPGDTIRLLPGGSGAPSLRELARTDDE